MRIRFIIGFCVLLAACGEAGSVTVESVREALSERGVRYDVEHAERAAAEGLLKAVDPRARLQKKGRAPEERRGDGVEDVRQWPLGLLYVKLKGVFEGTAVSVCRKIAEAEGRNEGLRGLIIDLRGSAGADLESVDVLAGLAAAGPEELYSVVEHRPENVEVHRVPKGVLRLPARVPIMVVINGGTSDGSELLAALLKTRPGVLLIGEPTLGDQSIRERVDLKNGGSMWVATGRAVPADGGDYEPDGVAPDMVISEESGVSVPMAPDPALEPGASLPALQKEHRELLGEVVDDGVLRRATWLILGLHAVGLCGTEEDHLPALEANADEKAGNAENNGH
ncbi:MAG: S41 family peptidase [Kiritimatiellia bacterium]